MVLNVATAIPDKGAPAKIPAIKTLKALPAFAFGIKDILRERIHNVYKLLPMTHIEKTKENVAKVLVNGSITAPSPINGILNDPIVSIDIFPNSQDAKVKVKTLKIAPIDNTNPASDALAPNSIVTIAGSWETIIPSIKFTHMVSTIINIRAFDLKTI
jgi:hypothetical protein